MNIYRKEINQNELQRSFEFVDYPEYQKYYSKQISPDFKKPKKIIVTEIYDEIIPQNKLGRCEYYDYYRESSSPYNNYYGYHRMARKKFGSNDKESLSPYNNYYGYHKMARKKFGSQDKNYYLTSRKNRHLNSNFNDYYSEYNKQLYFGDVDLREEYNSPSNIRANIRRKVYRGSNTPEPIRNYYTLNNDEDFLENFQYYESKNIKDKSNKKYQSITRVIGYSNLIPLNYNTNENNFSNVSIYKNRNYNQNLDNINLSRYKNINKELNKELYTNVDYNSRDLYNKYQINEEQKPETPEKITTVNIQKEIKNYEIPKEPQTSINNSNIEISTSKYESTKLPQTTSNISNIHTTTENKYESIKLPTTTTTEIVEETRQYESIKKPENITTTSIDDIMKKYDLPRNRPTTPSIKPTYKTNIDTSKYNNNRITKKTEKITTTTTSVDDILKKYELPSNTTTTPSITPTFKVNIVTSKYNTNSNSNINNYKSIKKTENITTTTTSVDDILKKYEVGNNRATTPSIRPTFKVNIDTSKYNTKSKRNSNSNSNKYITTKTTEKVTTTSVDDILKKYEVGSNRATTPNIRPTFKVNIDTSKYNKNSNSNSNNYKSIKTTEKVTTTTTSVDDILKKYEVGNNRSTTPSIKPTFKVNIDTSKYNTNINSNSNKYKSIKKTEDITTTSVDDILKKYEVGSNRPTTPSIKPTFKVNIDTSKYNNNSNTNSNKYITTKTTEKVTTTTTSVDDILKKYNIPSNRATTPSIKPSFKVNIDTSKYSTNSNKKSIGSYKYKSDISESNIINSRLKDFGAKNLSTLEIIEKNSKIKEKKNIPNITNVTISKVTKTTNNTDNLPTLSRNIVNNRFDSLKLNDYNSLSNYNNNLRLNETKISKTKTEYKKIDTDNSYKPTINIEPNYNKLSNIKINENITKTLTETKNINTNKGLNKAYKSNIDIQKSKNTKYLNRNHKNNLKIYTYNQDVNLETSKGEYNNNEYNNNEFIDMNARAQTSGRYLNSSNSAEKNNNKNVGYFENKEINKIEIKKKKKINQTTPLKIKKKKLGDNYKYYESKFMLNPNDNTQINSYTLHQRRNEKIIYGNEVYGSEGYGNEVYGNEVYGNEVIEKRQKMKAFKKPKKKGYRVKSKKIIKKRVMPYGGEQDNYIICNKYYEGKYYDEAEGEVEGNIVEDYEENEEENNMGQKIFYYQ